MSLLRSLFQSPNAEMNSPSQTQRTWPRIRRSQSAAIIREVSLQRAYEQGSTGGNPPPTIETRVVADSQSTWDLSHLQNQLLSYGLVEPDELGHGQHGHEIHDGPKSSGTSHRLKKFMHRFRRNKYHERHALAEGLSSLELPDIAEVDDTDPVKDDRLPQWKPFNRGLKNQDQSRNTSQSSAHTDTTVYQYLSRHQPLLMQEEVREHWYQEAHTPLDGYAQETMRHYPEVSDPFSDGKAASTRHRAYSSSRYNDDPLQSESGTSRGSHGHSRDTTVSHPSSAKSHSSQTRSSDPHHAHSRSVPGGGKMSPPGSESIREARTSSLDPVLAVQAFNDLAAHVGLEYAIPDVELAMVEAIVPYLRLGRKRQTNFGLGSLPPATPDTVPERLRRVKSFADLMRRPEPMTSLQGFTLERLALLGGHSFLVLPPKLAPCSLQLPACIVASISYLRACGFGPSRCLFVEPGDLKKAVRLYDYFADHVLSAVKDEARIASTVRSIAMPVWTNDEVMPALSVGWTLKAVLAGLPGGILGSATLFEALKEISYFEGTDAAGPSLKIRTELITTAIVALTSEMQCALLVAVFGFLAELSQADHAETQATGSPLRAVASTPRAQILVREFGPLLTGARSEPGLGMRAREPWRKRDPGQVNAGAEGERVMDEERVAGMLLDNWFSISAKLRMWASEYLIGVSERV